MRGLTTPWRRALLVATAGLVLAGASTAAALATRPDSRHLSIKVIKIGALLDLRAGWTSLGHASFTTLFLAAQDVNERLAASNSQTFVELKIVDVRGDPARARSELRRLAGEGVRFFVGPQSSAEVKAVRPLARSLGVIVISQGSTAHSLAIGGDDVYRLVPDDRREGEALVALLERQHVDALVPIWRTDPGNAGLVSSVRAQFRVRGGRVSAGVPYGPKQTAFASQVAAASRQVQALQARPGTKVGVYLAGFGEVVDVFHAAAGSRVLSALPWYGSDGVALSPDLVRDKRAAAFVAGGYPSPTLGLDAQAAKRSAGVRARARQRLHRTPDALALTAYDAFQIAARAGLDASGTTDAGRLRQAFEKAADGYEGITGRLQLNAAGDRAYGSFDFWSVCRSGSAFTWRRTFSYLASGIGRGHIVKRDACSG